MPATLVKNKLVIPRRDLYNGVRFVAKAAAAKSSLPLLGYVHLDGEDGRLHIECQDGSMWARRVTQTIVDRLKVLVPARRLLNILSMLPEGDIEVTDKGSGQVEFSMGSDISIILNGVTPEDWSFAEIPEATHEMRCELGDLRGWLRRVMPYASRDNHRPILTGVLGRANAEGRLVLVATDTYRLIVLTTPHEVKEGFDVFLPLDLANLVLALPEKAHDPVSIGWGETRGVVRSGDHIVVFTKIPGTYPNWERVVPVEDTLKHDLLVPCKHLDSALRRCLVIAGDNASRVRLTRKAGEFSISGTSEELGSYREVIPQSHAHKTDFAIALNGHYLREALANVMSMDAVMRIGESSRPLIIKDTVGDCFTVLMPMALV